MFAYVKYSDGEKEIVPASRIRHFNPENVNFNKKYRIEWNEKAYEGIIISVAESEEQLEEQIASCRPKIRPLELYQAVSDLDSASENILKDKTNDQPNQMAKQILDSKLEKLEAKLGNCVTKSTHEKKTKRDGSKDSNEEERVGKQMQKNDPKINKKNSKSAVTSAQAASNGIRMKDKGRIDRAKKKEGGKDIDCDDIASKSAVSIVNQATNENKNNDKKTDSKEKSKPADKSQPRSTRDDLKNGNATRHGTSKNSMGTKCVEHTVTSSLKSSELDGKLDGALKDLESYKTLVNRLKKTIVDKDIIIKDLTQLKMDLQKKVVNEFDELKEILGQLNLRNDGAHFLDNDGILPIGYRRANDNTIHLGRNVWLQKQVYDSIICGSRSPAIFVKNMALAVFGSITLKNSSVTGTVSNRTKNTSKAPARPPLDATKMLALKDILRFWLTTIKKYNEVAADVEAGMVGSHLSHKIYELNRPPKQAPIKNNFENIESDSVEDCAAAALCTVIDGSDEVDSELDDHPQKPESPDRATHSLSENDEESDHEFDHSASNDQSH